MSLNILLKTLLLVNKDFTLMNIIVENVELSKGITIESVRKLIKYYVAH